MLPVQAILFPVNVRQGDTAQSQNKPQSADGTHRTNLNSRRHPREVNTAPKQTLNTKQQPQDRPEQQTAALESQHWARRPNAALKQTLTSRRQPQDSLQTANGSHKTDHGSHVWENRGVNIYQNPQKKQRFEGDPNARECPSKRSLKTLDVTQQVYQKPRTVIRNQISTFLFEIPLQ